MAHPLDQLYKTKLQLIAVLAVVGGIASLMLAHWAANVPSWVSSLPISEIGSTLFGTGLLAIFFEYVDRKHGDQRADERVREAVRHEAPAIRDAVLDSFAFDPDALENVASDDTLDRIATNALGLRLDDHELAKDVYTDMREQVVRSRERWRDLRVSVELSLQENPGPKMPPMFVATVRREYRVRPASSTLRLASTGDVGEYRDLLQDPTIAGQWYFQPKDQLDAGDRDAFELVQFAVNGIDRPIRRTQRQGSQIYSVSLGKAAEANKEVTVAYTYRALVQQHGHVFYIDLPRPTKGVEVRFNYTGTGISYVNPYDFIAGPERARIVISPKNVPERSVVVSFDGWVFPRSGVLFAWTLDNET